MSHRIHPRSAIRPHLYDPLRHAFVDESDEDAVWEPDAVLFDEHLGMIGVGPDATPIVIGWGLRDLGRGLAKISHVATDIASAPVELGFKATAKGVGTFSPGAARFIDKGGHFIDHPTWLGETLLCGGGGGLGDAQARAMQDAISFDRRIGIGVGSDASSVAIGWGLSDLGRGIAKGIGTVSKVATDVASKPGELALHGVAKGVGLINKDAGAYADKGAAFIDQQHKLGEKMVGGALRDIGNGASVSQAFSKSAGVLKTELRDVGPYAQMVASVVPGIGTGVAAAIGTGVALANGKKITDAMLDGVAGAIPGGPAAKAAFTVARGMVDGKNVTTAALEAARSAIPAEYQHFFDAGVALTKGKNVQDSLAQGLRTALPPDGQAIFDGVKSIASGKFPSAAVMSAIDQHLPPEVAHMARAAIDVAHGKDPLQVAQQIASDPTIAKHLPPAVQQAMATTMAAAHGKSLADGAQAAILGVMTPAQRAIAEKALHATSALAHGDVKGVVQQAVALGVPKEVVPAIAAVQALRSGDPIGAAKGVAVAYGGKLPPAAAQVISTATAIASGAPPVDVATAALYNQLTAERRAQVEAQLRRLRGLNAAQAFALLPQLGLPPEYVMILSSNLQAAQGRDPTSMALAVLRRFLPPDLEHEADAAFAGAVSERPEIVAAAERHEAREDIEGRAMRALQEYGFDPRRVSPAEIVGRTPEIHLPSDVMLMVPTVAEASSIVKRAEAGDAAAQQYIAQVEAGTRSGDIEAARRHEAVQLAREAHTKPEVHLTRGLRGEEIRATIEMARRASAA